MKVTPTPLDGLFEITTIPRGDQRGRFTRLFCSEALAEVRSDLRFVQVNYSVTREAGTVRGLHYQLPPNAEAKLVRCLRGRVWDVALDLRPQSRTFGEWHAVELSEDNERQLFIPEGFAHGFQTLTANAELLYQHTAPHAPDSEAGIVFSDSTLAIAWPMPVAALSARDESLPSFRSVAALTASLTSA